MAMHSGIWYADCLNYPGIALFAGGTCAGPFSPATPAPVTFVEPLFAELFLPAKINIFAAPFLTSASRAAPLFYRRHFRRDLSAPLRRRLFCRPLFAGVVPAGPFFTGAILSLIHRKYMYLANFQFCDLILWSSGLAIRPAK